MAAWAYSSSVPSPHRLFKNPSSVLWELGALTKSVKILGVMSFYTKYLKNNVTETYSQVKQKHVEKGKYLSFS